MSDSSPKNRKSCSQVVPKLFLPWNRKQMCSSLFFMQKNKNKIKKSRQKVSSFKKNTSTLKILYTHQVVHGIYTLFLISLKEHLKSPITHHLWSLCQFKILNFNLKFSLLCPFWKMYSSYVTSMNGKVCFVHCLLCFTPKSHAFETT